MICIEMLYIGWFAHLLVDDVVHFFKVVGEEEEEGEVEAADHVHHNKIRQPCLPSMQINGQHHEARDPAEPCSNRERPAPRGYGLADGLALIAVHQEVAPVRNNDLCSIPSLEEDEVVALQRLPCIARVERREAKKSVFHGVLVMIEVIAFNVMDGDVLLQPEEGVAANPVLRQAEQRVDDGVGRDGAVVGVVLHVEADKSKEEACDDGG